MNHRFILSIVLIHPWSIQRIGICLSGQAGDNIDSVKDRIVEYILENSSNSQSDWEQIMPDLFKRS